MNDIDLENRVRDAAPHPAALNGLAAHRARIIAEARGSASAVFDAHVQANEQDLLRYFQRRLPNGADAAEAFGELMLLAWRLRRRIPDEPVNARMWLFSAARNVLRDSRPTSARRSAAVARLADDLRTQAPPPRDDASVEVQDAIDRLPDDDAELVRLTYWEGLASHEAAAVLGINPSTARSRLSRAKQLLRLALEEGDEEEESAHVRTASV
ncbi:RNA polymerase sigma-70 factor (ECF subfamily) [Microbacterium sp. AG1240]|uniref:RNA polymerase sigma factor n=1 Tax=Microbacterium sp. AG1240 TaxID=2183992 RepID=UPI000EACA7EE|nr:sigma-70 family RNA polymerase sigma factor [Microbacterium sp. AG1240]RKT31921.1 RNA polymerase sigma-70 factor (ECF subfamily) [Microbacterium sp. AG1240]